MKTRIASIALVATIALAGVATAKTNKLTGAFLEDPPSAISVQVALNKDGKAKTLKSLQATFTERCTREVGDGSAETTESVVTKAVPGSFKIKLVNGKYRFSGSATGEDGYNFELSGVSDKKGKHVEGNLSAERIIPESETQREAVCNNFITNWFADK